MDNAIFLFAENWSPVVTDQFFSMLTTMTTERPTGSMFGGMLWSMLRFIAAIGFVSILAYYATKKMAGASISGRKSTNISVVESINLGGYATVKLVKAGEKYLVLGVTKERISFLSEIDSEQIVSQETIDFTKLDTPFGKILSRFVKSQDTQGNDGENDE